VWGRAWRFSAGPAGMCTCSAGRRPTQRAVSAAASTPDPANPNPANPDAAAQQAACAHQATPCNGHMPRPGQRPGQATRRPRPPLLHASQSAGWWSGAPGTPSGDSRARACCAASPRTTPCSSHTARHARGRGRGRWDGVAPRRAPGRCGWQAPTPHAASTPHTAGNMQLLLPGRLDMMPRLRGCRQGQRRCSGARLLGLLRRC
jgi:hypothetical protein